MYDMFLQFFISYMFYFLNDYLTDEFLKIIFNLKDGLILKLYDLLVSSVRRINAKLNLLRFVIIIPICISD